MGFSDPERMDFCGDIMRANGKHDRDQKPFDLADNTKHDCDRDEGLDGQIDLTTLPRILASVLGEVVIELP